MQVDLSNYTQLLPKVIEEVKNCNFIALDIEFTGLFCKANCMPSLFDSLEERYTKLRANVSHFIPCQLGLSLFKRHEERNEFTTNTYSFFCCPRFSGPLVNCFSFETGAIEFLADNSFDFNKFARYGIPFLNRPQEETFRKFMDDKYTIEISHSMLDKLSELRKQITDWMAILPVKDGRKHGENTFKYNPFVNPLLNYLIVDILRREYKNFWITQQADRLYIKSVSQIERKHCLINVETEEKELIDLCIGLTKLIHVLIESRKPIVGNNMMVDLAMLYQHFIEPLPVNLKSFKKEILKRFETILDVKSIVFNIKKFFPAHADDLSVGSLGELYRKLSKRSFTCATSFQPTIIRADNLSGCDFVNHLHDAGSDAYATGYVFLRVCAMVASSNAEDCIKDSSPKWENFINPMLPLKNKINLIRAAFHYLDLESDSQQAVRPEWLVLKCRDKSKSVSIAQIHRIFSTQESAIDFKQINGKEIILAIGNFRIARSIIEKFRKDENYLITRYNFIRHSKAGRFLLWSTFIVGAGSTGYLLYKALGKYIN